MTGGAGFVGSNLVRLILDESPENVVIVDNLLSAERANVPLDDRVVFIESSITNDDTLESLTDDFDFVF
ncbi:MAG: NAD-dependent epimerase/dehydratase family protein, partial [Verrucomicrobia bacterium]|nr:NAD-dependent epimerase/dehydratase family protein [Verrucomicrobiota bacterium]